MSRTGRNLEADTWPLEGSEHERVHYLGSAMTGDEQDQGYLWYHAEEGHILEGRFSEEEEHVVPGERYAVEAEESLGEALDRLGDRLGIDTLSEFAREHLESAGEDGGN